MLKLVFVLLCAIVAVQSICFPYNGQSGTGYINVCDSFKKNCQTKTSYKRACTDLSNKSFYYANSLNTAYQCKVYSRQGCSGSSVVVRRSLTKLPWRGLSFTCPWIC